MTRAKINMMAGLLPVVMSLAALAMVLIAVTTGWERDLADEGMAAHLFQLLIVGEIPIILLFLLTAERGRTRPVVRLAAVQAAAVGIALGSVAFFHL